MESSKAQRTIKRILTAATLNFARYGFDGARMDAIAKEAGVNKATIYYHIGGKKALYAAVLHEAFSERASQMASHVAAAFTAEDKLKVIFKLLRHHILNKPHISAIMMYEIASGCRNFPDILTQDFTRIICLVADTLQEGAQSGRFAAVHPVLIYLMAITPLAFYEKISTGLQEPLASGSKSRNVPVISFEEFGKQLEALILKSLKEKCPYDPLATTD
jgi:AcrR family transcriptional regulator